MPLPSGLAWMLFISSLWVERRRKKRKEQNNAAMMMGQHKQEKIVVPYEEKQLGFFRRA